jgi:beta-lactamase regulating signal transducer with metallopeptidase domain
MALARGDIAGALEWNPLIGAGVPVAGAVCLVAAISSKLRQLGARVPVKVWLWVMLAVVGANWAYVLWREVGQTSQGPTVSVPRSLAPGSTSMPEARIVPSNSPAP